MVRVRVRVMVRTMVCSKRTLTRSKPNGLKLASKERMPTWMSLRLSLMLSGSCLRAAAGVCVGGMPAWVGLGLGLGLGLGFGLGLG